MAGAPHTYMRLAIVEAERGRGRTSPNPLVGCVLVKRGRIVGVGHHRRAGAPHAEVVALRQAGSAARGADVYTTLEPCSFVGRTGACSAALIAAGVRRVVAGMVDPNPKVCGKGLRQLRAAGIPATAGLLEDLCRRQNEAFIWSMRQGRPFVTVKLAQSLDGKVATCRGDSQWITGPQARQQAHLLRDALDAILVGRQTVVADDPQLTCRRRGGRDPLRVVLDSRARIAPQARVIAVGRHSSAGTLILVGPKAAASRRRALRRAGAEVVEVAADAAGRPAVDAVLQELRRRDILSLLVEGGPSVVGSFFDARRVDRVMAMVAPSVLGGTAAPSAVGGHGVPLLAQRHRLSGRRILQLGADLCLTYDVVF